MEEFRARLESARRQRQALGLPIDNFDVDAMVVREMNRRSAKQAELQSPATKEDVAALLRRIDDLERQLGASRRTERQRAIYTFTNAVAGDRGMRGVFGR